MERVLRRGHRCFIFMTRRPTVSCPAAQQQRNDAVQKRAFGRTSPLAILKPYLLADIGEGLSTVPCARLQANSFMTGIVECQIISWFVKPGDHIQQFERICEAQSDKASVEVMETAWITRIIVTVLAYRLPHLLMALSINFTMMWMRWLRSDQYVPLIDHENCG